MNLKHTLSEKINLTLKKDCSLTKTQLKYYFEKFKKPISDILIELQSSKLHWAFFNIPENGGRLRFFKQKDIVDVTFETPVSETVQSSFHRLVYELYEYQSQEELLLTDYQDTF
jgi:hypothetical protein